MWGEGGGGTKVQETRQVDALRMREIEIQRNIAGDLLFELEVRRVDARVGVIFAEDADAAKARERIRTAAAGRWCNQSRPGRPDRGVCKQAAGDRLLLHPVSRNGTHLRQH